jgi:hypothetical protein
MATSKGGVKVVFTSVDQVTHNSLLPSTCDNSVLGKKIIFIYSAYLFYMYLFRKMLVVDKTYIRLYLISFFFIYLIIIFYSRY